VLAVRLEIALVSAIFFLTDFPAFGLPSSGKRPCSSSPQPPFIVAEAVILRLLEYPTDAYRVSL